MREGKNAERRLASHEISATVAAYDEQKSLFPNALLLRSISRKERSKHFVPSFAQSACGASGVVLLSSFVVFWGRHCCLCLSADGDALSFVVSCPFNCLSCLFHRRQSQGASIIMRRGSDGGGGGGSSRGLRRGLPARNAPDGIESTSRRSLTGIGVGNNAKRLNSFGSVLSGGESAATVLPDVRPGRSGSTTSLGYHESDGSVGRRTPRRRRRPSHSDGIDESETDASSSPPPQSLPSEGMRRVPVL